MAVEIPNTLVAYGSVAADGTSVAVAGSFSSKKLAKGQYAITLGQGVNAKQSAMVIIPRGNGSAGEWCTQDPASTDTVKQVDVFDPAAAAIDGAFDFMILQTPQ